MRLLCIPLAIAAIACCQLSASAQKKDAAKAAALQAEVMKKVLGRFDLNGDGNVDDEEKAKVVDDIKKQMESGEIPEGFKDVLDRNRNGKLDKEEAIAFRELVARLQAGGGGPPQFGAGNAAGPGLPGFGGPGAGGGDGFNGQVPPELLKKFDKNKNGQLDEAEKKAALAAMGPKKSRKEQLQDKLDLNGDGKITKEEREQVAAQRKAEADEKKAAAAEKKAKSKKKDDDKDKADTDKADTDKADDKEKLDADKADADKADDKDKDEEKKDDKDEK